MHKWFLQCAVGPCNTSLWPCPLASCLHLSYSPRCSCWGNSRRGLCWTIWLWPSRHYSDSDGCWTLRIDLSLGIYGSSPGFSWGQSVTCTGEVQKLWSQIQTPQSRIHPSVLFCMRVLFAQAYSRHIQCNILLSWEKSIWSLHRLIHLNPRSGSGIILSFEGAFWQTSALLGTLLVQETWLSESCLLFNTLELWVIFAVSAVLNYVPGRISIVKEKPEASPLQEK